MVKPPAVTSRLQRRGVGVALLALVLPLLAPSPAAAAAEGWRRWWLPENLSKHGGAVDLLFNVIFIICAVIMLGVFYFLGLYCFRYRHRKSVAKAHFTHGNKKLELIWTIIPTIILLGLAVWTKGAWDDFRYNDSATDPNRAQILVIGEQFKWNVVYPGPDGKLGRYLVYPKTTDSKWPAMPPGDPDNLATSTGVPGPAYLPPEEARKQLNDY